MLGHDDVQSVCDMICLSTLKLRYRRRTTLDGQVLVDRFELLAQRHEVIGGSASAGGAGPNSFTISMRRRLRLGADEGRKSMSGVFEEENGGLIWFAKRFDLRREEKPSPVPAADARSGRLFQILMGPSPRRAPSRAGRAACLQDQGELGASTNRRVVIAPPGPRGAWATSARPRIGASSSTTCQSHLQRPDHLPRPAGQRSGKMNGEKVPDRFFGAQFRAGHPRRKPQPTAKGQRSPLAVAERREGRP